MMYETTAVAERDFPCKQNVATTVATKIYTNTGNLACVLSLFVTPSVVEMLVIPVALAKIYLIIASPVRDSLRSTNRTVCISPQPVENMLLMACLTDIRRVVKYIKVCRRKETHTHTHT